MTRILKYHGRDVSIIKQMQAGLPYSLRIVDCDTSSVATRGRTPLATDYPFLYVSSIAPLSTFLLLSLPRTPPPSLRAGHSEAHLGR
jgi:hypothetical protein